MISFKKAKTMGGMGSGNWYRWNKKTTTEEVHRVDIRFMKKQGLLKPNTAGSLSWNCGGESTGSVRYEVHESYLRLMYRRRLYGEEWESMDERIYFERTLCHYGGERLWFSCPHCQKRVAILYGYSERFLCRHCYHLPYASQSETYIDRMARKARKIRKLLNTDTDLDYPIFDKPKGMHKKTFDRIIRNEKIVNGRYQIVFEQKLRYFQSLFRATN